MEARAVFCRPGRRSVTVSKHPPADPSFSIEDGARPPADLWECNPLSVAAAIPFTAPA
jgi:hypothetical protein